MVADYRNLYAVGLARIEDPLSDDILLVGLSPTSKHEAAALRKKGNSVIFISDKNDKFSTGGVTYNLTKAADLDKFVALLGLDAAKSKAVKEAIATAGKDARDETAHIAWIWAPAEKGAAIPGRLIISGHSVGEMFWGKGNGSLYRDTVAKLATAMPKAAAQVQDLHLSACYCGGKWDMDLWLTVFPRLLTIWAYTDSAPGSYTGAVEHLHLWDLATRGDKKSIDRLIAEKTRKGGHVAVWSRHHGYQDGAIEPLPVIEARVADAEPTFQAYFAGNRTVASTQTGELRDFYNHVQALLQHPDLPAADRPAVEKKRDATIRLIYFEHGVKKTFARTHASQIERGYKALGLPRPDFARLNRKETLRVIQTFSDAIMKAKTVPADARSLQPALEFGLRDLQAAHIPESWIG